MKWFNASSFPINADWIGEKTTNTHKKVIRIHISERQEWVRSDDIDCVFYVRGESIIMCV